MPIPKTFEKLFYFMELGINQSSFGSLRVKNFDIWSDLSQYKNPEFSICYDQEMSTSGVKVSDR